MSANTNLAQRRDAEYQRRGAESFRGPDGKPRTPEEAKSDLRAQFLRSLALEAARKKANEFANKLYQMEGTVESLSKLARALLHRGPDGEYDGYRLSAIRRGSLADKLGIRNGDIIHSVNGTTLNSVQGAMAAFQSLSGGTSPGSGFKFEVTRRGQPVTLSYSVR